jgi:hypothetical protein
MINLRYAALTADGWEQVTESARGVPFLHVVDFIEQENLGDLWKPILPPAGE